MSLLPSFMLDEIEEEEQNNAIDIPREYGINYDTGELTGEIVEGLEAIKVWIWLTLQVERYRFSIYPWEHGVELEQYLVGNYSAEYITDAMQFSIKDALTEHEHILDINNFNVSVQGSKLTMSFHVETDLGGIDINV